MRDLLFLNLVIFLSISSPMIAQSIWSLEDQKAYSASKGDSSLWNMEMLEEDIRGTEDWDWPTKPAISNYPSPVPKYDWGYCALGFQELNIDNKTIQGININYAKDKYRKHLLVDTADYYINYFNIFILTDLKEDEAGANSIVSRNYPHYLSTGKQKTSFGSIDWVQMNLANGQNFAIINQRYFDLNDGKTILVAPLNDGSIRFLQLDDGIGSLSTKSLFEKKQEGIIQPKYEYLYRLNNNPKVQNFFTQKNLLE